MWKQAGWAFALSAMLLCADAATAAPPNVVIFQADDAGWGDYSSSGNQQVSTPNIDSIAQRGVSLDRFFVCPVCSPTRTEFLTGRYYPRGGVRGVSTGQERLNLDEHTVAEAFKQSGYATGCFGKWHLGSQWPYHPLARGFNEYFGYTAGHWGEYFDPPLEHNGCMIRAKGYIVDICTDRAIQFIEQNKDHPFLCYVPFTTPHSPWAAPPRDWERFKDRPINQPASDIAREQLDLTRCALAMIENQDANVGRVLEKLNELKLTDNTIVIYFSDNGPNSYRWNGGMKGIKGHTDEGGIRSVCYLCWPAKIPAGQTIKQISGAIDLLPTLTSLAGVKPVSSKPLDGRDLTPLLLNQHVDWPDRMIFSTWVGRTSVRTQQYRLDERGHLFDMAADPGQLNPINDREPKLAEQLAQSVIAWKQDVYGTASPTILSGSAVDPRPFTVGYREFPITMLPARDGEPRGKIKRSSGAPNCSYFVNWTSKDDSIVWSVDVHTAGRYEVTIDYTCPETDAGSTIELSFRSSRLTGKVQPGWNPPLYTNQDTLPRIHGESQMKEFHSLKLGEIEFPSGQGPLTLRAIDIPGKSVMDVLQVTLTLLP